MKSVLWAVVACFLFLFSANLGFAFTYDGTLNPNQLYAWEWKLFDDTSELGVDLVIAKNPKEGDYPEEVTLIVMKQSENILVVKNQIVGYFYGKDLTKAQFFLLDEETNHFVFQIIDLSDDEIVGSGRKPTDKDVETIGEGEVPSCSDGSAGFTIPERFF